ncbi:MAG TPA: class F sortase [Actinoplanes sp.]
MAWTQWQPPPAPVSAAAAPGAPAKAPGAAANGPGGAANGPGGAANGPGAAANGPGATPPQATAPAPDPAGSASGSESASQSGSAPGPEQASGPGLESGPGSTAEQPPGAETGPGSTPEHRPGPESGPGSGPEPGSTAATATSPLPASAPVHLDIPAIKVHTKLIRLGLEDDGSVEVPALGGDVPAGWYRNSVTPGEVGAAVLIGHVDSARDGPAVFYRLGDLRPGDDISVRRADGTTAKFQVETVALFPKSDFPTDLVYDPVPYPALRLVTCGGSFDRKRSTYRSNLVVTAR